MSRKKSIIILSLVVVLAISLLAGCRSDRTDTPKPEPPIETTTETITETITETTTETTIETKSGDTDEEDISEDGQYNSKDEVALYIKKYGHLPSNYVTKKEARRAGWSGGSLDDYFPGCSIGGDVFQNREGKLPEASGRMYYECDVDSAGRDSRGARRIIYSNDGLIFYTKDHYESFKQLYGKE